MDYDLISAPSNAIFLPPLLLRPFDAAHRINPIAGRAIDRLDRTAPDSGIARRGAGTHLVHSGPRVLAKAAGRRSADFLVPLIGNCLPQALPIALAEPADLFQDRVERTVGIGGGTLGRLGRRRDRGTHARRTAALDRDNRGGLLLGRQGCEGIELDPVVGDPRHVAQRDPHPRCDAIDTVNRAPGIGLRDAQFTGGGTKAACATACRPVRGPAPFAQLYPARKLAQLGPVCYRLDRGAGSQPSGSSA